MTTRTLPGTRPRPAPRTLPTTRPVAAETGPGWVLAAPFRAHVTHLMSSAQVPWPVVAYEAGISLATLRTLMFGRHGRLRSKIAYDAAIRLIELRPEDLRWLRVAQVNADQVGARIRVLRSAGAEWADIAKWLTIDVATCQAIARGERCSCSTMLDVLAQAACAVAGCLPWEDTDEDD